MTTVTTPGVVDLVEVHQHQPGPLDATCHLSYGDVPVAVDCRHRILDTFIHRRDLARATGQDDRLDPELVPIAYALGEPLAAELQAMEVFGTPVPVDQTADLQTRRLAMFGRDNRR